MELLEWRLGRGGCRLTQERQTDETTRPAASSEYTRPEENSQSFPHTLSTTAMCKGGKPRSFPSGSFASLDALEERDSTPPPSASPLQDFSRASAAGSVAEDLAPIAFAKCPNSHAHYVSNFLHEKAKRRWLPFFTTLGATRIFFTFLSFSLVRWLWITCYYRLRSQRLHTGRHEFESKS